MTTQKMPATHGMRDFRQYRELEGIFPIDKWAQLLQAGSLMSGCGDGSPPPRDARVVFDGADTSRRLIGDNAVPGGASPVEGEFSRRHAVETGYGKIWQ